MDQQHRASQIQIVLGVFFFGWVVAAFLFFYPGGNSADRPVLIWLGAVSTGAFFGWTIFLEAPYRAWKERRAAWKAFRAAEEAADAHYVYLRFHYREIFHRSLPPTRKEFEKDKKAILEGLQGDVDLLLALKAHHYKNAGDDQRVVYAELGPKAEKTEEDLERMRAADDKVEKCKEEYWEPWTLAHTIGFRMWKSFRDYL